VREFLFRMRRQYPKYKNSGIEWIGQIPSHWNIKRLKYLDKTIMGQSPESTDCNKEGVGIPFLQGNADFSGLNPIPSVWCEYPNKLAQKDDILLSVRAPVGAVNVADQTYGIGRGLCAIRPKHSHKKYSYYRALCLLDELNRIATGSTYTAVAVDQVNNVVVPNSAYDEQGILSNYLDRKTAQIDDLIAKKERMIELLKEERTAIINQAVTKGLDPKIELKDSGIEWLGKVPKYWEVVPLTKYLESIADYRGKTPEKNEIGGVFLVTARNIKGGKVDYSLSQEFVDLNEYAMIMSRGLPRIGDVLLTMEAPLGEVANVDKEEIALAQRVIKLRGKENIVDNYFLKYWMMSASFQNHLLSLATGSTALGLKASKLNLLRLAMPPFIEQIEIVTSIENQSRKIEKTIEKCLQEIKLLQEYRTALISEVVTGKFCIYE